MTTYADIVLEGDPMQIRVDASVTSLEVELLKGLNNCPDDYFDEVSEQLAQATACYLPKMDDHYDMLVKTFDIELSFPEGPNPQPTLQPGDSLYLLQIPKTSQEEFSEVAYLRTTVSLIKAKEE